MFSCHTWSTGDATAAAVDGDDAVELAARSSNCGCSSGAAAAAIVVVAGIFALLSSSGGVEDEEKKGAAAAHWTLGGIKDKYFVAKQWSVVRRLTCFRVYPLCLDSGCRIRFFFPANTVAQFTYFVAFIV